ncbi:hypothetical protein [Roseiconus lacunae]|uniref:hypothetical protein n=1 Tax=Roseiconus lacunae TaxID=2605694 RepID=UPI001E51E03D|nr:hypothetical protein [Roseiconus lacunae]MCD0459104.1 hypothetical protein [Roseiconus lacunae]
MKKKGRDNESAIIAAELQRNDEASPHPEIPSRRGKEMPEFYQRQFDGRSLAELLEMRDFKRDQIPPQFTVAKWKQAVRHEIQQWANGITVSKIPREASNALGPADRLPKQDRKLVGARAENALGDAETLRRYQAIQDGKHPDTGKALDIEFERLKATEARKREGNEAIVRAQSQHAAGRDMSPEAMADRNRKRQEDSIPPDRTETSLDMAQLIGDAVGVVDPTGIADGANAITSLYRAYKEPRRRGEHLRNAGISAISMIPYVGDVAKIGKAKSAAKTVKNAEKLSDAGKAGKAAKGNGVSGFSSRPWETDSINELVDAAKKGKAIPGGNHTLEELQALGVSGEDAARTMLENSGAMNRETGKVDVMKAAHVMDDMQRQAKKLPRQSSRSEGGAAGASAGGSGNGGKGRFPFLSGMFDDDDGRRKRRKKRAARAVDDEIEGKKRLNEVTGKLIEKMKDWTLGLGKVVGGVVAFLEGTRLINKGVLAMNSHLADYGPEAARAYASREIASTQRNIREARELGDALNEAAEADILADDVRSRFSTPMKGIFIDLEASASKFSWSLVDLADKATGASAMLKKLQGVMSDFADWQEGIVKAGAGMIFGKGDAAPPPDSRTAWHRFFDDVSDGKLDNVTSHDRAIQRMKENKQRDRK